ncbi:MAG: type II secretion system protein [Planctomycetes bacterium]|nr:type II secretion system protein [Planctomycetota bacterium]
MRKAQLAYRKGFTLIEVLVVVSIITFLTALTVPMVLNAQARAKAMDCQARARAIAATVINYTVSWEGMLPPDADTYVVKEMGYKLNTETGYGGDPAPWYDPATNPANASEMDASRIKELRCGLEASPPKNKHGIPQSYMIATSLQGANLLNLSLEASRNVAVAERGRRHRLKGDVYLSHYVFVDLHGSLGADAETPVLQGLMMRAWNNPPPAGYNTLPESRLTNMLYQATWGRDLMVGDAYWCTFLDNLRVPPNSAPGNEWNLSYQRGLAGFSKVSGVAGDGSVLVRFPRNFTFRWDGYLRYPGPGDYEIYPVISAGADGGVMVVYIENAGFSIPIADPGFGGGAQIAGAKVNAPNNPEVRTIAAGNENLYYPFKLIVQGTDWNGAWGITWIKKNAGVADPEFRNVPLSAAQLFFVP